MNREIEYLRGMVEGTRYLPPRGLKNLEAALDQAARGDGYRVAAFRLMQRGGRLDAGECVRAIEAGRKWRAW
jgi:hypothetical protein